MRRGLEAVGKWLSDDGADPGKVESERDGK